MTQQRAIRRAGIAALLAGFAALIGIAANLDQARTFSCALPGVGRICEATGLISISGNWDEERAWHLLDQAVEAEHRKCKPDCTISHMGAYSLPYRDRESIVMLLALNSESCHACGAPISVFQFDRQRDGWQLSVKNISAFEWGSWGTAENTLTRVQAIGDSQYGIFLTDNYIAQGYWSETTAIWCKLSDHYRLVFQEKTARDDSGAMIDGPSNSWRSTLEVADGSAGLFDILVAANGVLEKRPISEVVRFRFNGQRYVLLKPSPFYPEIADPKKSDPS